LRGFFFISCEDNFIAIARQLVNNVPRQTFGGKNMKKMVLLFFVLSALGACSNRVEDLKSPCVGAADSPCDRRPVNLSWNQA
jgi:hypothetical protein